MDMPKQIGPYRVVRLLGAGGMGEVYLVHDDKLDRPRAIKRLVPKDKNAGSQRERFRREARITARLEHPSIVRVFDVFDDGEATCIVMEYVPGPTLRQRVVEDGPLSVRDALRIGLQIADGMAKAHKEGIIHRDLKSENVLLHLDGTAKITDFGIAKELGAQTLTEQGKVLGTYTAMSPEQIRGEEVKQASDLFSFGILLYEALSGERPFTGRGLEQIVLAITQHQQSPLSTRIPGLPGRLSGLVDSLLIKHWSMRPASFRDVIDELKRIEAALDDAAAALKAPPVVTGAVGDDSTEDPESLAANVAEPEHAATPVDPGHAIVVHPVHGSTSQQLAAVKPGSAPRGRGPRRRWLPGVAAGVGVMMVSVLAYRMWPDDVVDPDPVIPERLLIAVPPPVMEEGCSQDPAIVIPLLRQDIERALLTIQGVEVLDEGYLRAQKQASALPDLMRAEAAEHVTATVACKSDRFIITLRRASANGVQKQTKLFFMPVSDLGLSDADSRTQVPFLYPEFEAREDVQTEDLQRFQRLREEYWQKEPRPTPEKILHELTEIHKSSPRFMEAYVLAAEVEGNRYREDRDSVHFDRALKLLERAQALAPSSKLVHMRIFSIAMGRGNMEKAENTVDHLEREDGPSGITDYLRALIQEQRGDTMGARKLLEKAAEWHPSWRILYHQAKLAMETGDIAAAEQHLGQLFERSPDNDIGRQLLWQLMGRTQPAVAAQFYYLWPSKPPFSARVNQAVNLMNIGQLDEAIELLEQAATERPQDLPAHYSLAEAWKLANEPERADDAFVEVLMLLDEHSSDPFNDSIRAQTLAHLGQVDEARRLIESVLARKQDIDIYYAAAVVYALSGEPAEAARSAERVLDSGYATQWFGHPWFKAMRESSLLRERFGEAEAAPARK